MAEKALAVRPNNTYGNRQQATLDTEQAKEQYLSLADKEFYYARGGGGRAPSAKLAKVWANSEHIHCKVLEYGADKEKAWGKVKAWKGDENNPTVSREDAVVLMYQDMLTAAIFEAIENGVSVADGVDADGKKINRKIMPSWEVNGETGMPVITDLRAQFSVMKTFAEKRKFAGRAAISTAKRRVYLELLDGSDDTDTEEHGSPSDEAKGPAIPQGSSQGEAKLRQPSSSHSDGGKAGEMKMSEGLKRAQATIAKILLARCDNDKDAAVEELSRLTGILVAEKKISQVYGFPSKIFSEPDALYILEVLETQEKVREQFVVTSGDDEEAARADFAALVAMLRVEDEQFPDVKAPKDIVDLGYLNLILDRMKLPAYDEETV